MCEKIAVEKGRLSTGQVSTGKCQASLLLIAVYFCLSLLTSEKSHTCGFNQLEPSAGQPCVYL